MCVCVPTQGLDVFQCYLKKFNHKNRSILSEAFTYLYKMYKGHTFGMSVIFQLGLMKAMQLSAEMLK